MTARAARRRGPSSSSPRRAGVICKACARPWRHRRRQLFFVASARKAAVLKAALIEAGEDAAAVNAIVAPAGQPIGAQTPEEIALSVLAAVVAARRGAVPEPVSAPVAKPKPLPLPEMPKIGGSCCGGRLTWAAS